MKKLGLVLGAALVMSSQAVGANTRFEKSLARLAPNARLEQLCDYTAMKRIRAGSHYRPDRAVSYAIRRGTIRGNTLVAKGAAFRSRHRWYHLSYTCKTTADRMQVVSFEFHVGAEIPESEWAEYDLWK